MPELFNEDGSLASERIAHRAEHTIGNATQHLLCLVDSGASVAEVKAYAFTVTQGLADAVTRVLSEREASITEKAAEGSKAD